MILFRETTWRNQIEYIQENIFSVLFQYQMVDLKTRDYWSFLFFRENLWKTQEKLYRAVSVTTSAKTEAILWIKVVQQILSWRSIRKPECENEKFRTEFTFFCQYKFEKSEINSVTFTLKTTYMINYIPGYFFNAVFEAVQTTLSPVQSKTKP